MTDRGEHEPLTPLEAFDVFIEDQMGHIGYYSLISEYGPELRELQGPMGIRIHTMASSMTDNNGDHLGVLDAYAFSIAYHNIVHGGAPKVTQAAIDELQEVRAMGRFPTSEYRDFSGTVREEPEFLARLFGFIARNPDLSEQGRYAAARIAMETQALIRKQIAHNERAETERLRQERLATQAGL